MTESPLGASPRYRPVTVRDLDRVAERAGIAPADLRAMKAVAAVLPFRSNRYVVEELIDWSRVPDEPLFQLTFPQPDMLEPGDLSRMVALLEGGASPAELRESAREIQLRMNPHPAGQMELNVPCMGGRKVEGIQHKYRETVLFFPSRGQTCHAYCTYCFRWAQFVGLDDIRFQAREVEGLLRYLESHPEVTDVLFTGGDPLIMKARVLREYVAPLLQEGRHGVRTLRIGTKAPAYWPQRFVSDPDADDLLRLFEEVVDSGRHLAVMAHFSHPRELETPVARAAIRRIRSTGAVVRTQAPVMRHVNDSPAVWARMWADQVSLGAVPYYMFVERDTGPRHYFELPLGRVLDIFTEAYRSLSGLARTVRGPSMSATPGKVLVDGVTEVAGEKVFVLKLLQARDPSWVNRVFFARFDPRARWLDDLRPAFGQSRFFWEGSWDGRGAAGPPRDGREGRAAPAPLAGSPLPMVGGH